MAKITTFRKFKILGEIFLAIPGLIFITFAVGEMSGGIAGSLEHFIELIPVVIFALACWRYPKKGGITLLAFSIVFSVLYFLSFRGSSLIPKLINESILFLPPIISGIFFVLAEKKH